MRLIKRKGEDERQYRQRVETHARLQREMTAKAIADSFDSFEAGIFQTMEQIDRIRSRHHA